MNSCVFPSPAGRRSQEPDAAVEAEELDLADLESDEESFSVERSL